MKVFPLYPNSQVTIPLIKKLGNKYFLIMILISFSESEKVFKPEVRRQEKYFTPDMNRRRLIDRAKMKSLRMSVVIVAAFLIWWTPYYVMMIIFTFLNPDKDVSIFCLFTQIIIGCYLLELFTSLLVCLYRFLSVVIYFICLLSGML